MATELIVLFALEREARPFRRLRPDVPVALTGVGIERAAAATEQALARHKPQRVILAGFGGALVPSLAVGDVIAAAEAVDESGRAWPCTPPGRGRVLTVNRMVHSVEEKRELGRRLQANVCDMESTAVAECCRRHGVEFAVVRAVSDTAADVLSPTLDRLIVNGRVSALRAMLAMLREPRLIGQFRRLARNTRLAAERLAAALVSMLREEKRFPSGPEA